MHYRFPESVCGKHSFCSHPQPEDTNNVKSKDFKSLVSKLNPNKKFNLREIEGTSADSAESNVEFLKKVVDRMDSSSSLKSEAPLVTAESLSDWVQQSLNRRFNVIPPVRPFLVSKPVYEYLKEVQEMNSKGVPKTNPEMITRGEIDQILENQKVDMHLLNPRVMGKGTPLRPPRVREREKLQRRPTNERRPTRSKSIMVKPANKRTSRNLSTHYRNKSDLISGSSGELKTVRIEHSAFNFENTFAKGLYSATRTKQSITQNVVFGKSLLGKVVTLEETLKETNFFPPLLNKEEMPDSPSEIPIFMPFCPIDSPDADLSEASQNFSLKNWNASIESYKNYFRKGGEDNKARMNIAACYERVNCYTLSKLWLSHALKHDNSSIEVIFGLGLACLKLKELGNALYFLEKALEDNLGSPKTKVYYLLAYIYRMIDKLDDSANYYKLLLRSNPVDHYTPKKQIEPPDNHKAFIRSLINSGTPFFCRFDPSKAVMTIQERLASYSVKTIEANKIFQPQAEMSYVFMSGLVKLRDHSCNFCLPKLVWRFDQGSYLHFRNHKCFYGAECHWFLVEQKTTVMEIPLQEFENLKVLYRSAKHVATCNILRSFKLFEKINTETIEKLVIENLKIKRYKKGQVIMRFIENEKPEKERLGIIIRGICDLKTSRGKDVSFVGRGECMGEESVFQDLKGVLSSGNLIGRGEEIEIGYFSPSSIREMPLYDFEVFKQAIKNNIESKASLQRFRERKKNNSFFY